MHKTNIDKTETKNQRIWNTSFVAVFIANCVMHMGAQMSNTLLSVYADFLGASPFLIGVILSVFAYTALALKLISGPALDAFNRPKLVGCFLIVLAAAFFSYGLISDAVLLIAGRLLQGVALAFTTVGCLTVASDTLPEGKLGKGIGYFSLGQAICQAIGPFCGLYISETISFQAAFFIGGCFAFLSGILMFRVKTKQQERKPFKVSLSGIIAKDALAPSIMYGLFMIPYMTINSFLVIYGVSRGVSKEAMGLYFTVYAVVMFITRPLMGALSDKYGARKVFIPTTILYVASLILIGFSNNLLMFLLAGVLTACSYGASCPVLQSACMKCVSSQNRGAASNTCYIFADIGNIIGPTIAGLLAGLLGYSAMWFIITIPVITGLIILFAFKNKFENTKNGTDTVS